MAEPVPPKRVLPKKPEAPPPPPSEPDTPLSSRLKAAVGSHPILKDEKKLHIRVVSGRVRVEGSVFTRDMFRQLLELVAELPGSEDVTVVAQPDIAQPQNRTLEGQIPPVSPGAGAIAWNYSVSHLKRHT